MEKALQEFIRGYEQRIQPLYTAANLAYWQASNSGKPEHWKLSEEAQMKLTELHANKNDFTILKKLRESDTIKDDLLLRQLNIIYNNYLSNQADISKLKEIIRLETEIEQKYTNFRAEVGGRLITDNEAEKILKTSTDSDLLKEAWLAHKMIGPLVSDGIIKLVKLRNEIAQELGFDNYHQMRLKLNDQQPHEIEELFNELDMLTRHSFEGLKKEIDEYLSTRLSIDPINLKPWHYQNRFFQEAPRIYNINHDSYYNGQDIIDLTRRFYKGIGLEIDNVIANSDLYERPGKNQHAYCIHIDRKGDVRVLCNTLHNHSWMNTNLHEFGHAVYELYIDPALPFVLRDPAHTFTTEAIAMIFGRFASNPVWMNHMGIITTEEMKSIDRECFNNLRLEQLVFSRWSQVMFRFEKFMYENPEQDVNSLWWNLVGEYQLISKPENRDQPDWAAKIHIAAYPCYYHNYHLGELLASQLFFYITTNIIGSNDYRNQSFVNSTAAGSYLKKNVFKPGNRFPWNQMIEKATGEKLTARHYARQFVY